MLPVLCTKGAKVNRLTRENSTDVSRFFDWYFLLHSFFLLFPLHSPSQSILR